ncbi:MAG: HD domain-containing protein [Cyanobacteria bacterium J06632_3]
MNHSDIHERLEFVRRAERLKDTLRSAYTTNGRTESVADHTWRLTLLVITFADLLPDLDLLRLLKICILHDLGEAIDGDIPAPLQVGMKSKSDKERGDFQTLMDGLPEHLRSEFLSLWDDYEYVQSHEAQVAKALDKLETLIQHNQGSNPADFDYAFNLDYGKQYTDALPLTARIRMLIDADTLTNLTDSPKGG